MHFVIKEAYSPNDQHRVNWSMNHIYYQVIFVLNNGLIDPSSTNIIANGDVTSQLVKKTGKKEKFGYNCTVGSVTSLRYHGTLGGNFGSKFSQAADSIFMNMNFRKHIVLMKLGPVSRLILQH